MTARSSTRLNKHLEIKKLDGVNLPKFKCNGTNRTFNQIGVRQDSKMYYSDFEVTDDKRIIIKEKIPRTIVSNIRKNIKDVDFVEYAQHPSPILVPR